MLIDGFGRRINYIRVSVTERCNFRCQYCMPEKPFSWVPKENLLTFEELFLFLKVGIDEGVDKIRITGGEPLLRADLDKFIRMINDYKDGIDIAITTNAYLLKNAKMSDLWMHLKDIPSTHVIIRSDKKEIPKNVIEFGAKLCVKFSTTQENSFSVDFTKRRNVKVIKDAKVNYVNYDTIKIKN